MSRTTFAAMVKRTASDYRFTVPLWVWPGENPWYFVTVPEPISDEIEARTLAIRRGFGSVRVNVTVGRTTWSTSVFPSKEQGAYVLPMKKPVRTAERLTVGDPVTVGLRLAEV
jgi:Domain of unknown function (DUF1905)